MKKWALILTSLLSFVTLSTQAATSGTATQVQYGVVQNSEIITQSQAAAANGNRPTLKQVAGAVAGGALGYQVGGGSGKAVAAAAGAVVGGKLAGNYETSQTGSNPSMMQIMVKLDNGQVLNVTQDYDGATYPAGTKVRVLTTNGNTTVDKNR